mgnify:CR=1 FL=1
MGVNIHIDMSTTSNITIEKSWNELKTKISDGNNKKDWLKGFIKKIEVISDYGFDRENKEVQLGHKFNITFHLKVVRDKFNWLTKLLIHGNMRLKKVVVNLLLKVWI